MTLPASAPPSTALLWLSNAFAPLKAWRIARAYRRLFGPGERAGDAHLILEDLALYCGLRSAGFVPGAPDQTAFNEGQRDVLLHLLSLANIAPDVLLEPAGMGGALSSSLTTDNSGDWT